MSSPEAAVWSAKPAALGAAAAGAVVAAVLAVVTDDAAGRLLLGLAAVGLLGVALGGALLRPRLAADSTGLVLRGVTGTVRLHWHEVALVEVARTRRLGREVPVLEISPRDTTERVGVLLLLTRAELGADPRDVLDRLESLRTDR